MKTITVNYIHGLASFLDEAGIEWEQVSNDPDKIKIFYQDDQQLFRIGFEFGKFYATTD